MLFVFAVLGYTGSGEDHHDGTIAALPQAAADERGTDRLSANELHKFAGLQRAEERVSLAHNHSSPPSKNSTDYLFLHAHALELRVQDLVSQRVERSRFISLSLTIRDIIFPFHYFW